MEIVQCDTRAPVPSGIPRDDLQMRRREIALLSLETSLGQGYVSHHGRRHYRCQSKQMRITIDRHPIYREKIVAHVATPNVKGRRSVGARRNTRKPLHPLNRVALSKRRSDRSNTLHVRTQAAYRPRHLAGVNLDGGTQRVLKLHILREGHEGNPQNETRSENYQSPIVTCPLFHWRNCCVRTPKMPIPPTILEWTLSLQ